MTISQTSANPPAPSLFVSFQVLLRCCICRPFTSEASLRPMLEADPVQSALSQPIGRDQRLLMQTRTLYGRHPVLFISYAWKDCLVWQLASVGLKGRMEAELLTRQGSWWPLGSVSRPHCPTMRSRVTDCSALCVTTGQPTRPRTHSLSEPSSQALGSSSEREGSLMCP